MENIEVISSIVGGIEMVILFGIFLVPLYKKISIEQSVKFCLRWHVRFMILNLFIGLLLPLSLVRSTFLVCTIFFLAATLEMLAAKLMVDLHSSEKAKETNRLTHYLQRVRTRFQRRKKK